MRKICILTFEGNPITAELFSLLHDDYGVYVIYSINTNFSVKQIWHRKRGLRWFWYNVLFKLAAGAYGVGHHPEPSWEELKRKFPGVFIKTDDHNSLQNQTILKSLGIDLGILIGTPLIKPDIFNIPRLGMVNLHQGNIPHYRGAPPAFWEHYNKECEMYVTVHTLVSEVDAGTILEETKFFIDKHKHFVVSKFYANTLSARMIKSAVVKAFDGRNREKREINELPNTVPSCRILFFETFKLFKNYFLKKTS